MALLFVNHILAPATAPVQIPKWSTLSDCFRRHSGRHHPYAAEITQAGEADGLIATMKVKVRCSFQLGGNENEEEDKKDNKEGREGIDEAEEEMTAKWLRGAQTKKAKKKTLARQIGDKRPH